MKQTLGELMNQIKVESIDVNIEVSNIHLSVELNEQQAIELQAGERMLVDSDQFAFLYIVEDQDGFHSLRFEKDCWPALKEGYLNRTAFYAVLNEHTRLALANLNEELDFLLENIQGNGNYGEAFEEAVKAIF